MQVYSTRTYREFHHVTINFISVTLVALSRWEATPTDTTLDKSLNSWLYFITSHPAGLVRRLPRALSSRFADILNIEQARSARVKCFIESFWSIICRTSQRRKFSHQFSDVRKSVGERRKESSQGKTVSRLESVESERDECLCAVAIWLYAGGWVWYSLTQRSTVCLQKDTSKIAILYQSVCTLAK